MAGMAVAVMVTIFLLAGAALAYVSGAAATLAYLASGHAQYLAILPQRIFSQLDVFAFMAMPLFILVGEVMNRGGITRALVDFSMSLVGWLKGGLGHVNIMTSLFFAGISGSAMADAAALSNTLVPAMRERGYSAEYAGAITAASAIIGPIIPPSIILIFYGAIMSVDVAALFAAGLGPGLLLASVLMLMNTYFARKHDHPGGDPGDRRPIRKSFLKAAPALLLPVIIMAGIIFGWMTPTEAAAVAVFAAIVIGYWYRTMNRRVLGESLKRAVVLSGSIFILIAAAAGISFLAALTGFPLALSEFVVDLGIAGTGYLLLLTVLFLIMGMFLDVQIALALVAPLLIPAAILQGADPVHIGVAVCLNLSMGLITPPLGGAIMVTAAITGTNYWTLVKATLPFVLVEIAVLVIIVLVPEISLFLPRYLGLM